MSGKRFGASVKLLNCKWLVSKGGMHARRCCFTVKCGLGVHWPEAVMDESFGSGSTTPCQRWHILQVTGDCAGNYSHGNRLVI